MPEARVNGININYKVQGQGEPLVLIMGLGGNQSSWRFQTRAFTEHFKVVTFDNRGAGDSDKPEGPYSTRQMADDTVGLMDHLGIARAHVLGVSLGGMIAQELVINHPDRVSKLILTSTCACHDDKNGRIPDYAKAIDRFVRYRQTPSVKLLFNKLPYQVLGFFLVRGQYARMDEAARTGFAAQDQAAISHNTMARLPSIKAPTLVIAGTGDKVIHSSSADTLGRLIPNSRIVKLRDGSHGLPFEMARRFNREVLDFLLNGES